MNEKCIWKVSNFFKGYKTSCGYQINKLNGKPVEEQIYSLKICPKCNKEIVTLSIEESMNPVF